MAAEFDHGAGIVWRRDQTEPDSRVQDALQLAGWNQKAASGDEGGCVHLPVATPLDRRRTDNGWLHQPVDEWRLDDLAEVCVADDCPNQ